MNVTARPDASRSVAKNTLLLTLGLLSGRALGVILIRKMTPILGTEGIGVWGAAVDISAILQVVTNFGLGTLLTREITRARGMTLHLFWNTLKVRWLIAAACYLILLLYVGAGSFTDLARQATLIMGLAIFIEGTSMACDAVLQAHEKVQYQSLGQILSALVYFVLGWLWLDAGHGLMGVIYANMISRVVRLAIMAPLMFMTTGPWRRSAEGEQAPDLRWMMKLGLPLFLATTFGIVYTKIDTVMLRQMVGDSAAGIYVLGRRALDLMLILPNIFGTALFPAMARYGMKDSADTIRLGERSLRLMITLMLPLTLFLTFTAGPIIRLLDPSSGFADSVPVLMIVIWGLPLQAANIVFNRMLITADRERAFIFIGLFSMLVNITLNTLWIPRYLYIGAAAATIVSMTVSFLLHLRYLVRSGYRPPFRLAIGGPVLATAAAWFGSVGVWSLLRPQWGCDVLSLPLQDGWWPFLAVTATTGVLYVGFLFLLRVIRAEDLRVLQNLLKPGKLAG
ncbi:hypothetical protein CO151_03165 [bacterium CG_4_9_14_3_um_filter_65_15]|nr:MAG: hypothetical protein CO151_03165 [bacterium CG_4_9_14_3_um_filter_65_15]